VSIASTGARSQATSRQNPGRKQTDVTNKSLLVDLGQLPCGCTDHALETLAKAASGEDDRGPDIWAPHDSPFIRSLIELFTSRGLMRIQRVQDELNVWLAGKRHQPVLNRPATVPAINALTWSPDELSLVRLYLESLPVPEYRLPDWGLVIDYLLQRYMPPDELQTEGEWLAVRSTLMGRVQANLGKPVDVAKADAIMSALPLTVQAVQQSFDFSANASINSILEYARLRCCDNVAQVTEAARHRLKTVIYDYQKQTFTGESPPLHALQTQLFDAFSTFNRDWRRIAVTEAGENANQGLIASLVPGSKVQRWERYRGACAYCKKINGAVLTVVDPATKKRDGETQVWVGKNNLGRSASPRKRVGDKLVERADDERWWIPAGTVHPNCRGMWHVLPDAKPNDDLHFAAWLARHLR
jgi:hypothetical protein